jgi:hypothetical protein
MELEFHQLDRRYEDLRLRRPEREGRLLASLAVVVAQEDSYLVIDGFKRLRCLERLKSDMVQATLWDLDESGALLLDRSQRNSDGLSLLEQGWLLAALRSQGMSQKELARRVHKDAGWVSRCLGLVVELPVEVQEFVRSGTLPAHAAMRHLVPIARISREDCLRLARACSAAQLSSREIGELCSAFSSSSAQVRERLLADPRLYLRARAQKAPPVLPAEVEMLRDLDKMAKVARRLRERLGDAEPSPKQLAELRLACAEVRCQLDAFEEETHRVGRADPDRRVGAGQEEDLDTSHCQAAEDLTQQRQEGHRLQEQGAADDPPAGEGRALSRRDPGIVRELSGQSREGPRRASGSGGTALLSGSDGVLSSSRDRDPPQAAGGQVQLRAGPGDAT